MKIGIIAFADKSYGGVYQYTEAMIMGVKQYFSNVVVFSEEKNFDIDGIEYRKLELGKGTKRKLINLCNKFIIVLGFYPFIFKSKEIKKLFSDIDVVISPLMNPIFYLLSDKPRMVTLHDMQTHYYPENFLLSDRIMRWVNDKVIANTANAIICESNFVKNDIIKFTGASSEKIHVIPSPPPIQNIEGDSKINSIHSIEDILKKYNLPEKYIFYPAQFWHHKNHVRLIKVFAEISQRYPDIYLVFSGAPNNNYSNVMNEIKNRGIESKVRLLGYIPYEDMLLIFKKAMILMMPSLFESISIPVYEAFCLGVPVSCSNAVGLSEQVGDAGMLFNPNDEKDMLEKTLKLIEDEELRNACVKKGYEKLKEISFESYAIKLKKLMECEMKNFE